jgi:hypothetical protein
VTNEGMRHLKGLTGLRSLTLTKTKVTPTGAKSLQAMLPQAKVYR